MIVNLYITLCANKLKFKELFNLDIHFARQASASLYSHIIYQRETLKISKVLGNMSSHSHQLKQMVIG